FLLSLLTASEMKIGAVLRYICAFGVFQKAVTEDARLSCQLTQTKDVVLVSWQKHFPVQDKFLASYHKVFGQKVNSDLEGKVEFAEAALQNSSIIIRNVTEQDDGCYLCVFIIFPDGDFTAKTYSDSSEETLVSCSATARPAPTVTLRVLQQDLHLSEHSSVSVNNTNGTVTVTATALLSRLHGNSTQVGCALRVLSGRQVEVFMTIPEVKHTSSFMSHRNFERNKTQQKTIQPTNE
uniref:Ig-like domain-containing protein n=1 Tax=Mola mola TaxID=94237 RepID=A0A3Q3VV41_MOLML